MPEIAERMLELAKEALAEQERQVADMRTRAATILGAGGVIGGLLGPQAFAGPHPTTGWDWLTLITGLVAAAALLVCALLVFTLRSLAFSMNATATYTWLYNNGLTVQPYVDLELADRLVTTRDVNNEAVTPMRWWFRGALGSLVVMTAALATAAALAS
ncbi:MAG: hypothetical protein JWR63_334 [Conexibacter sp.]|nr:hypothetical protein [Conexibacter sp.]